MHGAVIIFYFLGFLADKIIGNAQPKIIGGEAVDIKYRPFMLSLHDSYGFLCGANILSKTWGITALHCLTSVWSRRYYVRAGSNKTNRGGSVHRVTNIRVYNDTHFSRFSRMSRHDIALFEVRPPFRFSRTVQPIQLPRSTNGIQRELLVCGWGYTDVEEAKVAETLMCVYVEYVPFDVCVKTTPQYAIFVRDDYHLCYGSQGKDSCYGDSGGALASKRTIYGIVSFGHRCGEVPGVYVNVSHYRKWIKHVTNL